jgi:hypothetical protein
MPFTGSYLDALRWVRLQDSELLADLAATSTISAAAALITDEPAISNSRSAVAAVIAEARKRSLTPDQRLIRKMEELGPGYEHYLRQFQ